MATFSVIVPVYNAAHTIERCVGSIAVSGGEDVQIILVEDGGKDNSWEVCQRLAQKYPAVLCLKNERNRGVSYTRNRGLQAATGEYLLFVDSDDWVEPEWAVALLLEAQRDPSRMPVCGFWAEYDGKDMPQVRTWADCGATQQVPLQQAFDLMDKVMLQQLWTKIFSRETIERHQIRFDETQSMGEDLQFVLDYLQASDLLGFTIINKPLYHYRCNTDGLMRQFGLVNREGEYRRIMQLGRITGDEKRSVKSLQTLKKNHVYHILRSNLPRKEKRNLAKKILGAEACSYCCAQRITMLKERIVNLLMTEREK